MGLRETPGFPRTSLAAESFASQYAGFLSGL